MHILVTTDAVGGVWNYTEELVTGLAQLGVRVTLVNFGPPPTDAQRRWLRELSNVEFLPAGYRLEWMPDAGHDVAESMRYLAYLVEYLSPDLLHLGQFCFGALELPVPKVVVAHSDVLSWFRYVKGAEPKDPWTKWYRGVVHRGLAGADAVITPSRWMRQALAAGFGVAHKTRVICNGRSPAAFRPNAPKQNFAASIGRLWDEGKQLSLLAELDALPIPVEIAGAIAAPGEELSTVHLPASLHFHGELSSEQVAELLSGARIYIATSRYEPFGLAPLEAALSGCALLLNDIPSLRELWGEDALYFRRDSSASLHQALQQLSEDVTLCSVYAERACRRALQMYSATRMVQDYLALYSALLEQRAIAA